MHLSLLSGGFPCQDISTSGKKAGLSGERSGLWFEQLRIIRDLNPDWVLIENVDGLITNGLDEVLSGLEAENYEAQTYSFPAAAVAAWHPRQRTFIVAHSQHDGQIAREISDLTRSRMERCETRTEGTEQPSGSACRDGRKESMGSDTVGLEWSQYRDFSGMGWSREQIAWFNRSIFESEPGVARMVYGIPPRLDEIERQWRCHVLGNAVVPQQVYPILSAIAEIERGVC